MPGKCWCLRQPEIPLRRRTRARRSSVLSFARPRIERMIRDRPSEAGIGRSVRFWLIDLRAITSALASLGSSCGPRRTRYSRHCLGYVRTKVPNSSISPSLLLDQLVKRNTLYNLSRNIKRLEQALVVRELPNPIGHLGRVSGQAQG